MQEAIDRGNSLDPLAEDPIDLTRSLPPPAQSLQAALSGAARLVAQEQMLDVLVRASSPFGTEEDRLIAKAWLTPRLGNDLDPERIILTNGTQSAVLVLVHHFVRDGQVLAAETLSYGALRELTEVARVEVVGIRLDEQGIVPDHLEEVCRSRRVGALYCNPTFHNPTTAIMSEPRRLEIADVARRHGVWIMEDDAIGRLYGGLPRPIATLAPDVTWHISGLTKCIAQGVRMAYLIAPDRAAAREFAEAASRRTNWVAAPLMAALMRHMMDSGAAAAIVAEIASENIAREEAARAVLREDMVSEPGSPHVWVPLRGEVDPAALVKRMQREGVLIRPAAMFATDEREPPRAVRLSLSSPFHRASVIQGVARTAAALREFGAVEAGQ